MCKDKDRKEEQAPSLPEPYDTIAELLGADAAITLCKQFGGEQIYFPKLETVQKPLRNKKILSEFNGYNFKRLAKKYNLTEMAIRKICRDNIASERSKPLEGQISMFE